MEEAFLDEVERRSGRNPFDLGGKAQFPPDFVNLGVHLARTLLEVRGSIASGWFHHAVKVSLGHGR